MDTAIETPTPGAASSAAAATAASLTIPLDCVVFDTETTGLDVDQGDRLLELGGVRMRGGLPTAETYHTYINPERTVSKESVGIHGLDNAFLAEAPVFTQIAGDFLAFVGDMPLVAHNADFDAKFLNTQLREAGRVPFAQNRFIDTVKIARQKFPGSQVNLSTLCRRFKINISERDKHGALIDSQLLAEVCVELSGGRQGTFLDNLSAPRRQAAAAAESAPVDTFVRKATPEERERHAELIAKLGTDCIWNRIAQESP